MVDVAYLTDIEGQWRKLATFAEDNPYVSLSSAGDLVVKDGALLVFGGDAIDRGPEAMRIVATLAAAKARQPSQVVLLAGNRDINKLRLKRELSGRPPRRAPRDVADGPTPALLKWIFSSTMAAPHAFEHRRTELGQGATDDDVVASCLADIAPDGPLASYLAGCQLAFRAGTTLFVHGAVTPESLYAIPTGARASGVDAWVDALNDWYAESMRAFREDRDDACWTPLVAYQAPVPGTRENQASVIYGRLADTDNNPHLPADSVVDALRGEGISRLIVGHTPSGDAPSVLRREGFDLVLADNSYARIEEGSQVFVVEGRLLTKGRAALDDGARVDVAVTLATRDDPTPIGKRDTATGHLVKGRLPDGRYLLYRGLPKYAIQQIAEDEEELARRALAAPVCETGRR